MMRNCYQSSQNRFFVFYDDIAFWGEIKAT